MLSEDFDEDFRGAGARSDSRDRATAFDLGYDPFGRRSFYDAFGRRWFYDPFGRRSFCGHAVLPEEEFADLEDRDG